MTCNHVIQPIATNNDLSNPMTSKVSTTHCTDYTNPTTALAPLYSCVCCGVVNAVDERSVRARRLALESDPRTYDLDPTGSDAAGYAAFCTEYLAQSQAQAQHTTGTEPASAAAVAAAAAAEARSDARRN